MTPHGPGRMLAVIIGGAALVTLIVLLAPARHERSIRAHKGEAR